MTERERKPGPLSYLPKTIKGCPSENAPASTFAIKQLLGKGGFAECYLAEDIKTKRQFAVKIIDKKSQGMKKKSAHARLRNEIKLMHQLKHENILEIYDSSQDEHNYYLILEYCSNISLNEMLKKRGNLHELEVKFFIRQLTLAVEHLRKSKIIHRDIKTTNILLDSKLNLKLGDFGLAICADRNDSERYITCGTSSYMAPEIIRRKKSQYSYEVDMWSVGICTFALLFGYQPFSDKDKQKIYDKILKMQIKKPVLDRYQVSDRAIQFIKNILVYNPKKRLTPSEALLSDFLNKDSIPAHLPLQCYSKFVGEKNLVEFIPLEKERISAHSTRASSWELFAQKTHIRSELRSKKKTQKQQEKTVLKETERNEGKKKEASPKKKQIQKKKTLKIQQSQTANNQAPQNSLISNSHKIIQKSHFNQTVDPQIKAEGNLFEQNIAAKQHYSIMEAQKSQVSIPETPYEWLHTGLNQQIYIFDYMDNTQRYGFCSMLSNGVKIINFNDKTIMAYCEVSKEIVYLEQNKDDGDLEIYNRLMFRLISNQNAPSILNQNDEYCANNYKIKLEYPNNPAISIPSQSQKTPKIKKKKYQVTKYKASDLPKDSFILRKFNVLKQYCNKCPSLPLELQELNKNKMCEISLLECATLITQRISKKKPTTYMFVTKNYYQMQFRDQTKFFVVRKNGLLLALDSSEGVQISVELGKIQMELYSDKMRRQLKMLDRFLQHFKNTNGRNKIKKQN